MARSQFSNPHGSTSRLPRLDGLRGIAILAMVVFHCVWDLAYFGLIGAEVPEHAAFRAYGHVIAASFLTIAGISLVLADTEDAVLSRRLVRRFGLLGFAALAITLATYLAMPDAFIFFGILHCIFLSSLLALVFLRQPLWTGFVLAGTAVSLPLIRLFASIDVPWLIWLGLNQTNPITNDWRPLFPWSGFLFAGVGLGHLLQRRQDILNFLSPPPRHAVSAWLQRAGRNSLAIYMVHQPLLLLIFFGIAQLVGANVETNDQAFLRACETKCSASAERPFCTKVCSCIVDTTHKQPLWKDVIADRLSPDQTRDFNAIAAQCVRHLQPGVTPVP